MVTHLEADILECELKWALGNIAAKSLQLCPTLCDPVDSSPPGSTVHAILQARTLEWVVTPFSRDLPDPGTNLGLLHGRQIGY